MCGSPYDYCMPTYLDRTDDYRGCDTLYRSGSIFQQGDCYLGYGDDDTVIDRSANAGNFGVTTPVGSKKPGLGSQRPGSGITIGRPTEEPLLNGNGFDTPTGVEELLRENQPGAPTPLMPTPRETVPPPPAQEPPVETMPFTMPSVKEPTITVEDLRRLDPSVTDIKIITIDDALDTTSVPQANPSR